MAGRSTATVTPDILRVIRMTTDNDCRRSRSVRCAIVVVIVIIVVVGATATPPPPSLGYPRVVRLHRPSPHSKIEQRRTSISNGWHGMQPTYRNEQYDNIFDAVLNSHLISSRCLHWINGECCLHILLELILDFGCDIAICILRRIR